VQHGALKGKSMNNKDVEKPVKTTKRSFNGEYDELFAKAERLLKLDVEINGCAMNSNYQIRGKDGSRYIARVRMDNQDASMYRIEIVRPEEIITTGEVSLPVKAIS
jgi:hypothetical protein